MIIYVYSDFFVCSSLSFAFVFSCFLSAPVRFRVACLYVKVSAGIGRFQGLVVPRCSVLHVCRVSFFFLLDFVLFFLDYVF